ncbi:Dfp1/Him1, central region-domain-containing protein [Lineolata rhizophorae]|uniref:Dfp1/Him1, central region-domain-containing protein n=1 Tax=Lineolata rhizophorae TaxID=578093 RepID=A0A6A6NPV9_9PEZI|nr:Dfp1/Him1, central region-domain-containing protein [Lineolata rhizophorae]
MASRRVPLGNIPNGANSPVRPASIASSKRQRPNASNAGDSRELPFGPPPPSKKQTLEIEEVDARRIGLGRRSAQPPSTTHRRAEAKETKPPPQKNDRAQKDLGHNAESIRQWQRHYRRVFPSYVFYFEAMSEEARVKVSRQIHILGAREEKFFSKTVTHVVTTRSIPSEQACQQPTAENNAAFHTINPLLLDRNSDTHSTGAPKSKLALEGALHKKNHSAISGLVSLVKDKLSLKADTPNSPHHDGEDRRHQASNGDILIKARQMGMKIWALEKLQRMMTTMFENYSDQPAHNTRSNATNLTQGKNKDADLLQMLRNEKLHGPADRDRTVTTDDMATFRGYYVYISDMDEKTRPVMIREYPVVASREEGKWPQFRHSGQGRCPFVEDLTSVKKPEKEKTTAPRAMRAEQSTRKTRAATALEGTRGCDYVQNKHVLGESYSAIQPAPAANRGAHDAESAKPLELPRPVLSKRAASAETPHLFGSAQATLRGLPRYAGGEPIASGVQPSNVTSAIRSQMVSSTAPGPVQRAGSSKEVHQLKRKVLERNNASGASMPSSYMNDLRAAVNDKPSASRGTKRKAQDLEQIHEMPREDNYNSKPPKKAAPKDPKPGYCENCREKFNDFDEHVVSRKHRKFATTAENWTELDHLLGQLGRPRITNF